MKLLIPSLASLLLSPCAAKMYIIDPIVLPYGWITRIFTFAVRNVGNKPIDVVHWFNETLPTDSTAEPAPGGGYPFGNTRTGSFEEQLSVGVAAALGEGIPTALPTLYLKLNPEQDLSAEIIHAAQHCFVNEDENCGYIRQTARSTACVPFVRIMKYIHVAKVDYTDVIGECTATDIRDDVSFLAARFEINAVEVGQEETSEESEIPEEEARATQRRLLDTIDELAREHFNEPDGDQMFNASLRIKNPNGDQMFNASLRIKNPNDPEFNNQWHLQQQNINYLWDAGWLTAGGVYPHQQVITIISHGVWYNHPDLVSNVWTNDAELNGKPGVDDDGNGYIDDIYGWTAGYATGRPPVPSGREGTAAAGTIAAATHNRVGVASVAQNTIKLAICSWGTADTSANIAECIDWALSIGSRVTLHLHSSWSTTRKSPTLVEQAAYDALNEAGVLAVHKAGSDSRSTGPIASQGFVYPACYNWPNFVTVTASTATNGLMPKANWGENCITLAAPGENILSIADPAFTSGSYSRTSNTNHAAAYVAGAAGYLMRYNPMLRAHDIKHILRWATTQMPAFQRPLTLFGGIPDWEKASQAVNGLHCRQLPGLYSGGKGSYFNFPRTVKSGYATTYMWGGKREASFPFEPPHGHMLFAAVDDKLNVLDQVRAEFGFIENSRYVFFREGESHCVNSS